MLEIYTNWFNQITIVYEKGKLQPILIDFEDNPNYYKSAVYKKSQYPIVQEIFDIGIIDVKRCQFLCSAV